MKKTCQAKMNATGDGVELLYSPTWVVMVSGSQSTSMPRHPFLCFIIEKTRDFPRRMIQVFWSKPCRCCLYMTFLMLIDMFQIRILVRGLLRDLLRRMSCLQNYEQSLRRCRLQRGHSKPSFSKLVALVSNLSDELTPRTLRDHLARREKRLSTVTRQLCHNFGVYSVSMYQADWSSDCSRLPILYKALYAQLFWKGKNDH